MPQVTDVRKIARIELPEKMRKALVYARGDSGKHDDDWLKGKILEFVKGVSLGFHQWDQGVPINALRPKRSGQEAEPFVIEPDAVQVDRFVAPAESPLPETPTSIELEWEEWIDRRFAFTYALNQVHELKVGAPIRKFLASDFQGALEEQVKRIVLEGCAERDEKENKERQDALAESGKKKKGEKAKDEGRA